MRIVNEAGRALTRGFETFVPFTYDDAYYPPRPARADVAVKGTLTIGFGQTGPMAYFGARCTEDQAEIWLEDSLQTKAAAIVERDTDGIALTDNQFAALADFVFRCGIGNFESSTLLKDLLARDLADVPAEIARWDHEGGRVVPGLDRRCAAEVALWAQADEVASPSSTTQADEVASPSSTTQPDDPAGTGEGAGGLPAEPAPAATFPTLDAAIAAEAVPDDLAPAPTVLAMAESVALPVTMFA